MPARKRNRDASREKFWRHAIGRQATSGLTQLEFCKREGLNPNTLSYWKKIVRQRDQDKKGSKQPAVAPEMIWRFDEPAESPFVPVVVESPIQPQSDIYLLAEIRFSFATISIFSGANSCTLRDLLKACKECCD